MCFLTGVFTEASETDQMDDSNANPPCDTPNAPLETRHPQSTAHNSQPETRNSQLWESDLGSLSQWRLIRLRFMRHKAAFVALNIIFVLYMVALLAEFFAPYPTNWRNADYIYSPPQLPKFNLEAGIHTDRLNLQTHPVNLRKFYTRDSETTVPLGFFVEGKPYRLWGLIPMKRHFFGVNSQRYHERNPSAQGPEPVFMFLGSDRYGRDILSRLVSGSRISLSIGLVAIGMTFILGVVIGGVSGYFGGKTDLLIQRLIEMINSFPHIPLWLAIGAILPSDWPPLRIYFAITLVLSFLNWTGLARVVRGKILSLREEDYVMAARLIGAGNIRILFRHLVPGFTSHIIVVLTLSVPAMILGETALSFLGLGLRPPVVSWGVMMQDCINLQVLSDYPWLLMPIVLTVVSVLSFNFLGDGLRDAADPYAAV